MKTDFSEYTLEELKEARSTINIETYPERTVEIERLIVEKINDPEEIERSRAQLEKDKYSTFSPRLVASFIDGIILSVLSGLLIYIGTKGGGLFQTATEYLDFMQFSIYSILLHGLYGQTVGKMVMNVKVVDVKTEGNINFKQALLRDCVPVLSILLVLVAILFIPEVPVEGEVSQWVINIFLGLSFSLLGWHLIEIVTMLLNKKRRALHDFIAGTVVIQLLPMAELEPSKSLPD